MLMQRIDAQVRQGHDRCRNNPLTDEFGASAQMMVIIDETNDE